MPYEFLDEQPASGRYEFVDEPATPKGPRTRYTNPNRGKSSGRLAMEGARKFLSDTKLGVRQAAGDVAAAFGDEGAIAGQDRLRAYADYRKMDPVMRTTAGQVGYAGASLVPAVASAFIPGVNTVAGAAATGAVMGALQPTGENDSRLLNTGIGAGTAAAGQGVFNLIGKVAQPVKSALTPAMSRSVQTLERAGVPLDAAQRTNSAVLQRVRSSLTDNPLTVGGQQAYAAGQKTAFNRAVLRTIGANADVADEAVMGQSYSRIGQVFESVLPKYDIRPSSAAMAKLAGLENSAKRQGAGDAISAVANDIRNELQANGGKLSGRFYQNVRRDIAALESNPEYAPLARQLREGFDDAFQQTASKTDGQALQEARRQWRNMRIIENAVDAEGNISPPKLANLFGQKKNRYAGVYGKGDKSIIELAKLAKAGKNVIPDKLPNSGTAARSIMQVAAPAALGGLYGGYKEGDLTGVGMYALGGAALPFAAQKAINSPGFANYLANGIGRPVVRNALMGPSRVGLGVIPPALLLSQQ